MGRQHYIAIAKILAGQFAVSNTTGQVSVWATTLSLADYFAQADTHHRFNREQFYRAVFGNSDHFAVRDEILKEQRENLINDSKLQQQ